MRVTRASRRAIRLQNLAFVILFLGIIGSLAWLSTRHAYESDWTAGQRNTLSEASATLVASLDGPVTLEVYMRDGHPGKQEVADVVARYRSVKPDIESVFINPDTDPDRTRRAGISQEGEIVVTYAGRSERIGELTERSLTTVLQRVSRGGERWVVFIDGHGERDPHGQANHDYGVFAAELLAKGFRVQTLNPLVQGGLPGNTSLVVVAGPQVEVLPQAADMLVDWVEAGGNLLWLGDPGPPVGLEPLAELLGISFAHGVLVDPTAQMFGISDPTMIIVADYTPHPVTRDFSVITLFPHVTAVDYDLVPEDWRVDALLTSLPRSWLETGEIAGQIAYDPESDDRPGPLDLGITLSRPAGEGEQRVAVLGDGDFLSNAFLNNGGNLDLGLNLFNWLVHDDAQINIHLRSAPDLTLTLSNTAFYTISLVALIFLPLGLVATGVLVWWRRRRR